MGDLPNSEVQHIGHLGLIASIFDNFCLTEKIDALPPKRSNNSFQESKMIDETSLIKLPERGTRQNIEVKRIESNTMRQLQKGQCLFYDRSRKIFDVCKVGQQKSLELSTKVQVN